VSIDVTTLVNRAYEQSRPITAQLELTYKCNLLCSFCYNAPKQRHELDGEQWLEAISKLQAAGTFTVILTGGEPFVHRDFWRIAEGVRERGLVLKVYTNGVLLADRSKAERYAELAPFDTEISIHGARAGTHDRLTGIKGSFDRLLVALQNLSEIGVKVTLKTPITRLNQAELLEIDALAERFGYKVTYDTNINPTDDGDLGPLSLAAEQEFLIAFLAEQVRLGRRGLNPRPVADMKHNCGTGRTSVAIDPYGDVFPCIAWRRPVCNILEVEDFDAVWQGRAGRNETLDFVRKVADEVPRATLAPYSEGGFASFCPAVAEKETGDPYAFYGAARVSGLVKLEAFRRVSGKATAAAGTERLANEGDPA
jgi:MoaA/NifB/PqqE/SkfB family radical SAM enzyme